MVVLHFTILAASQSDQIALETQSKRHGILTYALVHDGIEDGHADYRPRDKRIVLSEWLQYAVDRVPKLFREIMEGRALKGAYPDVGNWQSNGAVQEPALFDFEQRKNDIVLVRLTSE